MDGLNDYDVMNIEKIAPYSPLNNAQRNIFESINPILQRRQLTPFYSVILEYCVEHSCLLPEIYYGYRPDADFIGTRTQANSWIENYLKQFDDPDYYDEESE